MKVCATCGKELTCIKTGMNVIIHEHYSYRGDLYQCSVCKCKIVSCNSEGTYHTEPIVKEEYDVVLND
ncbi:MAG: hypothetical protein EOM00_14675 [Clostridia bacterium]|nr:hypothetical protein [Clostridia bacterium]